MKSVIAVCVLVVLAAASGCMKVKNFPETPAITVLALERATEPNMFKATIQFTDGDGDIGLGPGDTLPPYDTASKYFNNVFVRYYVQTNGNWVKDHDFSYRIESITPAGKVKGIEGEMDILLFFDVKDTNKTVKYDFQLFDRALHGSNIAESKGVIAK